MFSDPAIFPFTCPRGCGATFKNFTSMSTNHLASGLCPIPLSCPRCPETFMKKRALDKHVKTCAVHAEDGEEPAQGGVELPLPVGEVGDAGGLAAPLAEDGGEPVQGGGDGAPGGEEEDGGGGHLVRGPAPAEFEVPREAAEELQRMLDEELGGAEMPGELERMLGEFGEFPYQAAGTEKELHFDDL